MSRKYGDDKRVITRKIQDDLIEDIESIYMKAFEKIDPTVLGAGTVARLTQLLLISKENCLETLRKKI